METLHSASRPLRPLCWLPLTLLSLLVALPMMADEGDTVGVTFEGDYYMMEDEGDVPSVRASAEEDPGQLYNINMVVVVGDREEVYGVPNWDHYENEALYAPMSEADIEAFRERILKDLQDRGFIFATVSVYRPSLAQGFLKLRVHVGELGRVTVRGNKHHSAEQILDQIDWNTGGRFDYASVFRNLYTINTNPGLKVSSRLTPRLEEGGRRVIDAEFTVTDRFPVTAGLTISNDGSEEAHQWRTRLNAQWFNPLKLGDVFGVEYLTAPRDVGEVFAITGSYVVPINDNWKVSVFGGYSETDLENVLPELDLVGAGYFYGGSIHRNFIDNEKRTLDLTLGWMMSKSENTATIGDQAFQRHSLKMSVPRITLSYTDKDFDSWGGRNFFSNTIMFHFAGALGSSEQDDFETVNPNSEGNFFLNRFTAGRFQKLWGEGTDIGSFTLFSRFDAQLSSDSLPSSMQKTLGGERTVRGYYESEAGGDFGYNLTLELRTPLLVNFISAFETDPKFIRENPDYWGVTRLQGVLFFDMGAVQFHDSLPGQHGGVSLSSVGAGLRFLFTKYAQMRLDYGFPLVSTEDAPNLGRVHFSGQLQF